MDKAERDRNCYRDFWLPVEYSCLLVKLQKFNQFEMRITNLPHKDFKQKGSGICKPGVIIS